MLLAWPSFYYQCKRLLPIWTPLSIPCTFVMGKISPRNPSSFHNSHRHSEPRGGEVLSEGLSSNFGLWPGPPFPNVVYHRSVSTVQNAGLCWESRVLIEQAGEALGSIRHSKQTNKTEHKIEWPDTLQGYHVLTPCMRCTSSNRMESSCGWNCIMLWAAMCYRAWCTVVTFANLLNSISNFIYVSVPSFTWLFFGEGIYIYNFFSTADSAPSSPPLHSLVGRGTPSIAWLG